MSSMKRFRTLALTTVSLFWVLVTLPPIYYFIKVIYELWNQIFSEYRYLGSWSQFQFQYQIGSIEIGTLLLGSILAIAIGFPLFMYSTKFSLDELKWDFFMVSSFGQFWLGLLGWFMLWFFIFSLATIPFSIVGLNIWPEIRGDYTSMGYYTDSEYLEDYQCGETQYGEAIMCQFNHLACWDSWGRDQKYVTLSEPNLLKSLEKKLRLAKNRAGEDCKNLSIYKNNNYKFWQTAYFKRSIPENIEYERTGLLRFKSTLAWWLESILSYTIPFGYLILLLAIILYRKLIKGPLAYFS